MHTGRSIYSSFGEYTERDAETPADPRDGCIYVIDTNVLLNLFKYTKSTATQLVDVLQHMQDALFVPHHVLAEFWPLLESVRRGHHHSEAKGKVQSSMNAIERELDSWLRRSGLEMVGTESSSDDGNAESIGSRVQAALDDARSAISRISETIEEVVDQAQENDWVLGRLETILDGHVGEPPSLEEERAWLAEFESRVARGLPPGNRDLELRQGRAEKASGDYFIWRQCLAEAAARSAERGAPIDLTLVTNDLKDDWTRQGAPEPLPRRELAREFSAATNGGVFRINTVKQIVGIATDHFDATSIDDAGLAQIAAVDAGRGVWTVPLARRYLVEFWNRPHYRDQLVVLLAAHAAERNGLDPVTFSEARELTRRDSLAGFASPYRTIAKLEWFDDISEPMLWSDYPERGEGFYILLGNPVPAVTKVISDDDDFAEIADDVLRRLCEQRGIDAADVEFVGARVADEVAG